MELVRYSNTHLKPLCPPRAQRRTNIATILVLAALSAVVLFFLYLSERSTERKVEEQREQLSAQLTSTTSRLHDLSKEVDSLSSRATLPQPFVNQPTQRTTLPRGNYAIAKIPHSVPASKEVVVTATNSATPAIAPSQPNHPASVDYSTDISTLNGAIAVTHDQLLELERKGVRHYIEFTLDRNPAFREVGPVWIQVRKINVKRGCYDLSIIVNGHKLDKSHVNLYEPIWINTADRAMQYQLVANAIDKNQIVGYLSEPKNQKAN